jgi:hypothetical protein
MLTRYPTIPAEDIDRQGKSFLFCDVALCQNKVEVTGITQYTVRDQTFDQAPMPSGWVTSDPDNNAVAGAAQFCPDHNSYIPQPVNETSVPASAVAESSEK